MRRFIITAIIIITVCYGIIIYFFSSLIITPKKKAVGSERDVLEREYGYAQDFVVQTNDGLLLKGWFFNNPEDGDCGAVILHGWGNNREGVVKFFPLVWDRGCDIAIYDHRAHGDSEGEWGAGAVLEAQDLLLVHDWLKDKTRLSDREVAWIGESWGAVAVIHAASEVPELSFIVADSPFGSWEEAVMERGILDYGSWIKSLSSGIFSIVKARTGVGREESNTYHAAAELKIPVFLIHSKNDEATSSEQSVRIAENLNPTTSVFHHTEWGSAHVKDMVNYPKRYAMLFEQFLVEQGITFGKEKTGSSQETIQPSFRDASED